MASSANIIVGPANISVDGVDVGYTQGGVSFKKALDYLDVEADQSKGVMRKEVTMERAHITTTLLESTLANMRTVFQEAASQAWSGSALAFGMANPVAIEHTLTITGKGPAVAGVSKTRTYTFYRAIKVDEVDHMIGARDAASILPVTFELLKDENYGSRFGFVYEV